MTRACLPFDPATRRPRIAPPPGAIDCHAHIFGPIDRFPFISDRSFTPPEAMVADYLRMLDTLGFERGVIVHGSVHGTDNRPSAAAIAQAPDRLRGVAVIDASFDDAAIAALHEQGFRGTRMSTVVRGGPGFGALEAIAGRVKAFSWHLVVHVNRSSELIELAPRLLATGLTIVFDHAARIAGSEGIGAPAYRTLLELLATDRAWIKLSGLHRMSSGPWPWRDQQRIVEGLIAARLDRLVWGTDWPHPNHFDLVPNDGDLFDAFCEWVPDATMRTHILVDNASALYRF
ncbi:MAG: amidohydrolase family protein [Burkholderiales bacterium]